MSPKNLLAVRLKKATEGKKEITIGSPQTSIITS